MRKLIAERIPVAELLHDSSIDLAQADTEKKVEQVSCRPVEVTYRVQGINIDGSNVYLSEVFS